MWTKFERRPGSNSTAAAAITVPMNPAFESCSVAAWALAGGNLPVYGLALADAVRVLVARRLGAPLLR